MADKSSDASSEHADYSAVHFLFHYGIEFLQAAEILSRLQAADCAHRKIPTSIVKRETFYEALRATLDGLKSVEDLTKDPPSDVRKLREQWSSEARALLGYLAKYRDTTQARNKRYWARRAIAREQDPRVEAKKMAAARMIGHAGPGSVDRILTGKKAQGGVYDIDAKLFKANADVDAVTRYLVPPVPEPPRRRRKR